MAYAIVLDDIPAKIVAGESVSWKYSDSRFPASGGWSLSYTLVNVERKIDITSVSDGDDHLVEIPSATSSGYEPDEYSWAAYVTDGTERYQVETGVITITPDYATQYADYDPRSFVKQMLDALEAACLSRATKTQLSYNIGGVQIQHMTMEELTAARDDYAAKYHSELVAAGQLASSSTIKPKFPM